MNPWTDWTTVFQSPFIYMIFSRTECWNMALLWSAVCALNMICRKWARLQLGFCIFPMLSNLTLRRQSRWNLKPVPGRETKRLCLYHNSITASGLWRRGSLNLPADIATTKKHWGLLVVVLANMQGALKLMKLLNFLGKKIAKDWAWRTLKRKAKGYSDSIKLFLYSI